MSNDSRQLIVDEVVSLAERIEEEVDDPFEDLEPLEVTVNANLDGTLREIFLVMATGGPHLEVALYASRVDGSWAMEEHSCHVNDEAGVLDQLADYYTDYWEGNIVVSA